MVFLFVCRFVSFFDMTLIGSDTIVMEGMGCFVFTSIPISLKIMRGKKKQQQRKKSLVPHAEEHVFVLAREYFDAHLHLP
jgi:hypothetical protein